jgi:hypothetical protein
MLEGDHEEDFGYSYDDSSVMDFLLSEAADAMDESDDEDEEDTMLIVQVLAALSGYKSDQRRFKMYNQAERVDWDQHVTLLQHRNEFEKTLP